ncbi:unnamed protein product [Closterium sp. NIES-54]
MNISLANAQNDLSIANKILAQQTADLNAYNDDPTKFPQIPAAQKAVTEATRCVNITSMLIQKWQSTVQDAVQAEAEAEKTFMNNPSSTAAQVVFVEAQETHKYMVDVYGDIVMQDLCAQARLMRVQQELTDLQLNPPTVDVNVFPKAVEDAKVAVFVDRQVYDGMLAAITDAQKAVILYKAMKIANGRHPTGLSAPPAPDGQGSSAPSPSAGPSRVRRQPPRTGATVRPVAEKFVDDDDEEDADEGDGSDEENEEPEDTGMSPSDDEGDDDYGNDDAEEKVQPVTQPLKRSTSHASAADKGKGKVAAPPARQEPRKKRSAAPVERGMWSDKESTIFAAARWFTKDELEPLKGKQGT